MRNRTLPLVLVFAACAASDAPRARLVADFVARSEPVRCVPAAGLTARGVTVGDVVTLSDTSFLVLYPTEREVVVYGADLMPRRVVRFAAAGPVGVRDPASAALVGDTLVYIADRGRQALRLLSVAGEDRGTIDLRFSPQRVRAVAGAVLVMPMVVARQPRHLVYRMEGTAATPLDVPIADIGDPVIGVLANAAGIAVYPDGRIVVAHEMVVPYAYRLRLGSGGVERVALPLPDGIRESLEHLPPPPLTDERIRELPVVALSLAADAETGDLVYLTRSGRRLEDHMEKAIVRADAEFRYVRSYLLDVNAIRFAYLGSRDLSIVVDEVDQWYQCPTP
ncbi:MAG TPA: hypothetical protein VF188_05725 [Longimicrobiales bacterium]